MASSSSSHQHQFSSNGYPAVSPGGAPQFHSPSSSSPLRYPPPPPLVQPTFIPSPPFMTPSPNTPSPGNVIRTATSAPHLSTPPGPPVFSSPLQPAAVPFRTSPATPQLLAVSSGSSLPTSSSTGFPNGSAELQQQAEDPIHDTVFPNVLFSASKVLKQRKLANIPSLGFGAIVSAGQEVSPGPQIVQRDPHRCQSCGAYSSPYCNILVGSGQWQCIICRNLNGSDGEYVASSKDQLFNFPELSSTLVDYVQTGNKRQSFSRF